MNHENPMIEQDDTVLVLQDNASQDPAQPIPADLAEGADAPVGSDEIALDEEPRYEGPAPNVYLKDPVFATPKIDVSKIPIDLVLNFFRERPELVAARGGDFARMAESLKKGDTAATAQLQRWFLSVAESESTVLDGGALLPAVDREGAQWTHKVTFGSQELGPARPALGEAEPGGPLTGRQAVAKIDAMMGLGSPIRIPLWHSGFWVTFYAPTELAWLELDRRIAEEKIALGRQTGGLVYSNASVYTTMHLLDFVVEHIETANIEFSTKDEILSWARTPDIPYLLMGLLISTYPAGYNYSTPCVADPNSCNHVESAVINLVKMLVVDNNHFTDFQRQVMSRRTSKISKADLTKYQEEHRFNRAETTDLGNGVVVEFKVPTVAEYRDSGYAWVQGIVARTDEVFKAELSARDRNAHISQAGTMTILNQYAHWIKSINAGGEMITDAETIQRVLARLSSSEEIFETFFSAVGKYISDSSIALVCTPRFDCPACKRENSHPVDPARPYLIPIDVEAVFFTLLRHRIFKGISKSQPRLSSQQKSKAAT